ncbi:hypothetical protein SLS63_011876 [Diaporthe eres]|uniref:High-affinity nicotinic acid transporter n=1 Tax=Diaporthe eres TaxID=83184 RepID=A0ABR1NT30_DIAER
MSTLDVARKTGDAEVPQSPILVNTQGQARIVRKFDRQMLPIVCILYVLSYLDRGNIGNAKTAGIQEELSLDDQDWTWVLQGFYISYVLFEWTQLFWKLFPAHIYVAILCFLWGTAAMVSGATHNLAGLVAVRVLLGIFEASFGAGAPYFLSLFYQRQELGKQRADSITRLETRDRTAKAKVNWSQIAAGLMDYQNYVHALIHFSCNYSFAGLSNFAPTIVKDMGYDHISAQGLVAPAYFASFLCCMLAAWLSDRYSRRGWIVAAFSSIGAVGYLLLAAVQDETKTGVRYAGLWLAACGIFPALCINMTWLLNNQGGDSKRGAGLGILATFGETSSFQQGVA